MRFSEKQWGTVDEAKRQALDYFKDRRDPRAGEAPASGKGHLRSERAPDGLLYHGGRTHTFAEWAQMKEMPDDKDLAVAHWNPLIDTLEKARVFCPCSTRIDTVAPGAVRYRCHGHLHEDDPGPLV